MRVHLGLPAVARAACHDGGTDHRKQQPHTRRKRPGGGCRHVFIDAGSNRGVHGRFLFEPEKYPLAARPAAVLGAAFGAERARGGACCFAFEPNPAHRPAQAAISRACAAMGWRYTHLPAAVGGAGGGAVFYRNVPAAGAAANDTHEGWGFSVKKRTRGPGAAGAVTVRRIGPAKWLRAEAFERHWPARPGAGAGGFVLMKMDIEGPECRTPAHLLTRGVLCRFGRAAGGLHGARAPPAGERWGPRPPGGGWGPPPGGPRGPGPTSWLPASPRGPPHEPRTPAGAGALIDSANAVLDAAACPRFERFDDEVYLHDGQPLPSPRQNRTEQS